MDINLCQVAEMVDSAWDFLVEVRGGSTLSIYGYFVVVFKPLVNV